MLAVVPLETKIIVSCGVEQIWIEIMRPLASYFLSLYPNCLTYKTRYYVITTVTMMIIEAITYWDLNKSQALHEVTEHGLLWKISIKPHEVRYYYVPLAMQWDFTENVNKVMHTNHLAQGLKHSSNTVGIPHLYN